MLDFWRSHRRETTVLALIVAVAIFLWRLPAQRQWALDVTLIGTTLTGNLDETRNLLARGADANTRDDNNGMTPLMCAARGDTSVKNPNQAVADHAAVVKLLIDHGASVNARDRDGKTALHHAAEHGQDELVQVLIDRGAAISAADRAGRTPRLLAEQGGHDRAAAVLRKAEARD